MNRKKTILTMLILAAIALAYFSFYLSYFSGLAGFIAAKYGGGEKTGEPGRIKSIIIHWRRYRFHLHHWLLGSLAGAVCALKGFYIATPELFFGFLGGLVFQGIYCYADWHRVVRVKA